MTGFPIHVNSFGEHPRHADVKTSGRHAKAKAGPRHGIGVSRTRTLGLALLAGAAAVVVVGTFAIWAPTFGASPIVAHEGGTSVDRGPASVTRPTLAPAAGGVEPIVGDGASAATAAEITAARTFAGSQLARNTGLTLSATARELLVGGQVDARSILSLGQYLAQAQLTVADFPASDAGDAVRRQILMSDLAGVPLGTGASAGTEASESAAQSVEAWFRALSAPVDVQSVVRTPAGVLVTFAPGEPSSMLPTPPPSL